MCGTWSWCRVNVCTIAICLLCCSIDVWVNSHAGGSVMDLLNEWSCRSRVMSDDLRGNHAHPRGARTGHDPAVARAGSDGRGGGIRAPARARVGLLCATRLGASSPQMSVPRTIGPSEESRMPPRMPPRRRSSSRPSRLQAPHPNAADALPAATLPP